MFTAMTLSMALAAPVPPPGAPVPAGVAPRVVELKPDTNGKVTVAIIRTEMQKVQLAPPGLPGAGGAPGVVEREVAVTRQMMVELGEVKDLTITTADGKKLDKDEALKKLEKGGIVVISGDGNPVSPAFLKVFKDDTLVLVSKELVVSFGSGAVRPGAIRPAPVPLPAPVPPGGAIQIQPGVIQVVPAVPAAPAVPAQPPVPVKPEK